MTHRPFVWICIAVDVLVALFFVRSAFAGIPFTSSYAIEKGADGALPLAVAPIQLGFALFAAPPAYFLWRELRFRWLLQALLLLLLAIGALEILWLEHARPGRTSGDPASRLTAATL